MSVLLKLEGEGTIVKLPLELSKRGDITGYWILGRESKIESPGTTIVGISYTARNFPKNGLAGIVIGTENYVNGKLLTLGEPISLTDRKSKLTVELAQEAE